MDTRRAPVSDFSSNRGNVNLTSDSASGEYVVRTTKYCRITGENAIGEPVLRLALDTTIDPIAHEMSKAFERYKIKDAMLVVQSGSPLGTSSGGVQLAHIPDPANGSLSEDPSAYDNNLEKVVRQGGSCFIRPRDSTEFKFFLDGSMFTKNDGSSRWSSYGSIVAVVRSPPDGADFAEWTMTFSCTVLLIRPALIDSVTLSNYSTTIQDIEIEGNQIFFHINFELPATSGRFVLSRPLLIKGSNNLHGRINTQVHKITTFRATVEENRLVYTPDFVPIALKSHNLGCHVNCAVPALADNVRVI